jgi:thiol-disulfide isomerase/thioredoxin
MRATTRFAWVLAVLCALAAGNVAHAAGFNMKDVDGVAHQLSEYRGKWVLVNFWATWCAPCVEEIPDLSELYDAHKNELVVLGVAMDYEDAQGVIDFAKEHKMSYPLVLGSERIAAQIGKVKILPATFIYNPEGEIVLRRIGPITREEVERMMRRKKQPNDV